MDPAQLAPLLQQLQDDNQALKDEVRQLRQAQDDWPRVGGRKILDLPTYSYNGVDDWMEFRARFETIAELNRLTNDEAKLALKGAMQGTASATIQDIDIRQPPRVEDVLNAYEARFLPASASQMARVNFEAAAQRGKEGIMQFHARLRTLWRRAYPNIRDDVQLIRRFALGLRRREVREMVLRNNPLTYGGALEIAQNETSVLDVTAITELGARIVDDPEAMDVSAVQGNRRRPGTEQQYRRPSNPTTKDGEGRSGAARRSGRGICHFCREEGHWKNECTLLARAARILQEDQKAAKRYASAIGAASSGTTVEEDQDSEPSDSWETEDWEEEEGEDF